MSAQAHVTPSSSLADMTSTTLCEKSTQSWSLYPRAERSYGIVYLHHQHRSFCQHDVSPTHAIATTKMKYLGFLIYRSNIEKIALQKRQQSGKRAKPFVCCIFAISLCVSQIPVLGCRKSAFALTLQLILCFFRRHGCGCGYTEENCLLCKEERWFRTFCVASRQSDVSQAAARPAHVSKPKSIDKASLHDRKLATSASLMTNMCKRRGIYSYEPNNSMTDAYSHSAFTKALTS